MYLLALCDMSRKLFKLHPHLLYFRHVIPFANCQPELARPVEYDVGNVDRLQLFIRCPLDVSKLEEFLDCGEHGRDWFSRVVNCLLDNVFLFKELVRHQLTVVVLHIREYACHSIIY